MRFSREEQPAFFHSYEYLRGNKLGVIKLNPSIHERLAKDSVRETLHPRHLPMLVKPKLWLAADDGGYIYNKCEFMRMMIRIASLSNMCCDSMGNALQRVARTGELLASRIQSGQP